MVTRRYLHQAIADDLKDKMVFVGGPRQVGKTTLAIELGKVEYSETAYLNWDSREDRKNLIASRFPAAAQLLILDEIHKYRQWKNYVKGLYDTNRERFDLLVTGSARLDIYRQGGDSLMGRYHHYRLHPFSLAEALQRQNVFAIGQTLPIEPDASGRSLFEQLFEYGGFPEPFLKHDGKTLRRWHNQRIDRLIKEDIRDTESIRDLSALQILTEMLKERVGSLLSLNALREDLNVAHKTVSHWMDILERFYYHYRIYPFASNQIKSLKKEPKLYLWDWSEVPDPAARFENVVASHLLKFCHFLHDTQGYRAELFFLRDVDGREVDFLIAVDRKPWFAVEVKTSALEVARPLRYFTGKLAIPYAYQVVMNGDVDVISDGVRVVSADRFLSGLV